MRTQTWWEFTIELPHRPGELSQVARAFGDAGVNFEGFYAWYTGDKSPCHFVVRDQNAAKKVISSHGWTITKERQVCAVEIEDRPGMLADYTSWLAEQKINLDSCYLATNNYLVIGAENFDAVRKVFEGRPEVVPTH